MFPFFSVFHYHFKHFGRYSNNFDVCLELVNSLRNNNYKSSPPNTLPSGSIIPSGVTDRSGSTESKMLSVVTMNRFKQFIETLRALITTCWRCSSTNNVAKWSLLATIFSMIWTLSERWHNRTVNFNVQHHYFVAKIINW